MGRPKVKDKLVNMNYAIEPAVKAVLCQLAEERNISRSQLGAELVILGLTLKTGKNLSELISANGGKASE